MGRTYKTVVALDDYPRVDRYGTVTHPLEGYEFVVPTKGPLHSRVPGQSANIGLIRRMEQF